MTRPTSRVGNEPVVQYEPGLAMLILTQIAEGDTVIEICKQEGFPSRKTFYKWVNIHSEFRSAFMAARELSAMALEEKALIMAEKLSLPNDFTGTKIRAFEVAMGQYRWSAARRDPKRFGQQQNPMLVVPIQINTSLDMGRDGSPSGTAEYPDIFTIEARIDAGQPEGPLQDDPLDVTEVTTERLPPNEYRKRAQRPKELYSPGGKRILVPPSERSG